MEEEDDPFISRMGLKPNSGKKPLRPPTIKELNTMLNEKDSATVLLRIARDDGCFERLLKENEQSKLELTVKVLGKALENGAQPQAVIDVIKLFLDAEAFYDSIGWSLMRKLGQDETYVKAVLTIFKVAVEKLPNTAPKRLSHIFLPLCDVIDEKFHELRDQKNLVKQLFRGPPQRVQEEEEGQRLQRDEEYDANAFRELTIIPSAEDLNPGRDVVVRANKVHGHYNNINEYLDIQFRLLRADLIIPLRENINKYLADADKHENIGINVYSQVRIVRPICHDKGLCFRLSFDISRLRKINWNVSQKLKYGSLLCLSLDNFNTYLCAVVEHREVKDLERGLIDVQFIMHDNRPENHIEEFMKLLQESRDQRYTMVESPTYFEAYKYVLEGLKAFTENNFPFWKYIGECNPNVGPPQYLVAQQPISYDLRPLVDKKYIITDDGSTQRFSEEAEIASNVKVLEPNSWPNANTFGLDNSQFVSLQSALTKEFSIIQGPPGTGKTFIGLLIMKALLHNKQFWLGDVEHKPILLVCYTNHALDQFLEGILDFFQGKMVRVGSRSKSERLEDYNLRGLRHRARENRSIPTEVHLAKQQVRLELKEFKVDIHREAAKLEILETEIVKESFLKDFIHPDHYKSLTQRAGRNESVIVQWLGIKDEIQKILKPKPKPKPNPAAANVTMATADTGGAVGDNNAQEEENEDEEDAELDEIIDAMTATTRYLDIDEDDDDDFDTNDDDLFAELLESFGGDFMENVRSVNKKLDDVDQEAIVIKRENVAFNISEYGEEKMPYNLSKEEKEDWKSQKPKKKFYRGYLLKHLQTTERMSEDEAGQVFNVWRIPKAERWRLYRYWVDLYCRQIRGSIRDTSQRYEEKAKRYQEILHQEDKVILQKATIIGMTTTGAARYQGILREIGPKIVLVEEAAEVLEGHVLTSLSEECQHVVLIGDHKQLRPNPSVFKLKKDYNIDISLFERLILNHFELKCLKYQHRMRPEISKLLRIEDLYPDLEDHDVVKNYPHVTRVKGDVCFIQHSEVDEREGDTKTFKNTHEAEFLIGLCEYLIHQGYSSKQITILSPYAGQIHLIKTLIESKQRGHGKIMKGLKISSVDNYQGEENDIILLSLVRSNESNEIGFLKANNRICVALSRAKIGLYVIGNFLGLSKSSPLIEEIIVKAKELKYLKDHLVLTCIRHKGGETLIRSPRDFKHVPEGGCSKPCAVRLECGHSCKRICHSDDPQHENYQCSEKCQYRCEKCDQNCTGEHRCGQHDRCRNLVKKIIPICGHTQDVPCHEQPNLFECRERCREKLQCGHPCPGQCGKRHSHTEIKCTEIIEVTPTYCGHNKFQTECWKAKEGRNFNCTEPCKAVLECEHVCSGTCGSCQNGRLHVNCTNKCSKILICGHQCRDTCNSCPPCTHPCENACQHSTCPKKCGDLCSSCVEECSWQCKHEQCKERCCQPCSRPACDNPCPLRLKCGHNCSGLCGETCPHLCVICNKEELMSASLYGYDGDPTTLFIELDCGHVLEVEFVDHWMSTSTATPEGSDQEAIGLKTCPLCKTPIRKCERYNKQIKEMLCLIESVKRKYIGEKKKDMKALLDQITAELTGQEKTIIDAFLLQGNTVLSETILEAQINQVNLCRRIFALRRVVEECKSRWEQRAQTFDDILFQLGLFANWTLLRRAIFSQQNRQDAEEEINRLSVLIDLLKIELNISTRGLRDNLPPRCVFNLGQNIAALSVSGKINKKVIEESKTLCEELLKLVPESHIALTNKEKMEIVKAVNVSKGAWYKCPNGHIYAIGDCGRAMEEAKCPECKQRIGGTNHELVATNAMAPEMDGAEAPIWDNLDADRALAERLQQQFNDRLQDFFF